MEKNTTTTTDQMRHNRSARFFAQRSRHAARPAYTSMGRTLIDRDTSPGAEPEDLMRLDIPAIIVPGRDASHATSAARYLQECLPKSEYWDIAPDDQQEQNTTERLTEFLTRVTV